MKIVLKHRITPIKNGYRAENEQLRGVAHGLYPEMARRNLQQVALHLFSPFERSGTLRDEIGLAGLEANDDGYGRTVEVV